MARGEDEAVPMVAVPATGSVNVSPTFTAVGVATVSVPVGLLALYFGFELVTV